MKRKLLLLLLTTVLLLLLSTGFAAAGSYIDTSDVSKGLIHVTYQGNAADKVKLMITKDSLKYVYDVNAAGRQENFSLQLGNGSYKLSLLIQLSGDKYSPMETVSVDVQLADQNTVFLTSVQNIDWNASSAAIAKAVALTSSTTDLKKKAQILWNYMAKNNTYDYKKAASVTAGYLPVIDTTLRDKKGICYDFSSLYAAMLRSQGIPAKLIKGYAPKYAAGYHAWNEVYDASQGKWITVDSTYDLQIIKTKPKLATMSKNSNEYKVEKFY